MCAEIDLPHERLTRHATYRRLAEGFVEPCSKLDPPDRPVAVAIDPGEARRAFLLCRRDRNAGHRPAEHQGPDPPGAGIDRELARAQLESEKPGWITYAIHDPTTLDHVGQFNTLIVYVGQTKNFASRVKRRLREAGTATRRPTSYVEGLMYDIMRRGGVPRFRVIERAKDAIDSFVSETNWAQDYIAQGYPLRNKWKSRGIPARR
ncbi:hypothetical protein [Sphingomicrobium nitratireducens]|uniref:hypothetical protein n=1 Tax=Sphingomicrobium nitratireducens TaxID=2964666 RepID=UPI0022407567|nr:hypothetical protein [Sphingomicrobium nitratireducens]